MYVSDEPPPFFALAPVSLSNEATPWNFRESSSEYL
jgi:hypothetical protein